MKFAFSLERAKRLLKRREESEPVLMPNPPTTSEKLLWQEMQKARGEAAWMAQGPARGWAAVLRLLAEKLPKENPHAWLLVQATKAEKG